jgi:putative transposase
LIDWDHKQLSIRRQCELLGLNRSTLYYRGVGESEENLKLMRLIDEQYLQRPFYGSRKMTRWLISKKHEVNRRRRSAGFTQVLLSNFTHYLEMKKGGSCPLCRV